jgi:hypothetical protein
MQLVCSYKLNHTISCHPHLILQPFDAAVGRDDVTERPRYQESSRDPLGAGNNQSGYAERARRSNGPLGCQGTYRL